MLRPPNATVFPYTTLFRSAARRRPLRVPSRRVRRRARGGGVAGARRVVRGDGGSAYRARLGLTRGFGPRDRKSTRLNSSHMSSSYVLFWLEKKMIEGLSAW